MEGSEKGRTRKSGVEKKQARQAGIYLAGQTQVRGYTLRHTQSQSLNLRFQRRTTIKVLFLFPRLFWFFGWFFCLCVCVCVGVGGFFPPPRCLKCLSAAAALTRHIKSGLVVTRYACDQQTHWGDKGSTELVAGPHDLNPTPMLNPSRLATCSTSKSFRSIQPTLRQVGRRSLRSSTERNVRVSQLLDPIQRGPSMSFFLIFIFYFGPVHSNHQH